MPINPKLIWEAKKDSGGQEALEEAEFRADLAAIDADEENNQLVDLTNDDVDSDALSDIFGEIENAILQRKKDSKSSKNKAKATATHRRQNTKAKSDLQFVISAIANIKSAANYMLNTKIKSGVVEVSNLRFSQLSYQKIFQRKVVTQADMEFFRARLDIDKILGEVDDAIKNSPEFEWLPKSTLSNAQLLERERLMTIQIDEAVRIREMCERLLLREKEHRVGEIVERLTNEAQQKGVDKEILRQEKELAKREKIAMKQREREEKEKQKRDEKERKMEAKLELRQAKNSRKKPTPRRTKKTIG